MNTASNNRYRRAGNSSRSASRSGFTTIELMLVVVIIVILGALIISTRAGVQQKQRDSVRERDIKELRDGLEGYFATNNQYPSLKNLNDADWRQTHLKALEGDVFRDPRGNDDKLVGKAQPKAYAYMPTSASGGECGEDKGQQPCTRYTLTATLEGGGAYTKGSLN